MKAILLSIIIFLSIFILFDANISAQDWRRWDLPDGAKLRLGKGSIQDITYSPDGNRLIVESSIGFWIYDAHTGVELDLIAVNTSNILGVSPDTSIYVSKDSDNTVSVRNITDSSVRTTLKGNTSDLYYVIFNLEQNILASDIGNEIRVWDLTTGELKTPLVLEAEWIRSIALSPDGTTVACISIDNDSPLFQLWNLATGSHIRTLSKYAWNINNYIFTPDGNTLISTTDNTIQLWDVATGNSKLNFNTPRFFNITLNQDGNTLATSGSTGMHLWDIATGTHITELGGILIGGSIAFSPDGKTLASGGGEKIFLWDIERDINIMSISGHTYAFNGIAFSPNENILATSGWKKLHLWDPTSGEYIKTIFGGHWSNHADLVFTPDGNTIVCSEFYSLHLWDVSNTRHIATLYGVFPHGQKSNLLPIYNSIALSPDGQLLAAGHNDTTIHLWNMGRTAIEPLTGHTERVTSIAFSHDSRLLVSGSDDHTVLLWDPTSRSNIATFTGHTDKVHSVAFNHDASIVASGGEDNTIILWDVTTDESRTIHTEHTKGIHNLSFSMDGNILVSGGIANYNDTDPLIQIWDVATGEPKATLSAHTDNITGVIFSPDGSTLASASLDGTVLIWDYTSFLDTENEISKLAEDVNRDGKVDLQDLIFVATQYGQQADGNAADVNGDGVINIADILLVAAALENVNGAPSKYPQSIKSLTAAQVNLWLDQALQINNVTPYYQKGIANLEQLLLTLTPKMTTLLPNYPNPFNPETWIPFQLAKPSNVNVHIYSSDGQLVRTLVLGNQPPGLYQNQSRAAYWDGKNEIGEPVASGVYFYSLSAGNFTASRRMVIRK